MLLPACSLLLCPSLPCFLLSLILRIEDVNSLCKWTNRAVMAARSLPGHPAFFCLRRIEDVPLPSASGWLPRRRHAFPLFPSALCSSLLLVHRNARPRSLAGFVPPIQATETTLCGAASPLLSSPSQADPFLHLICFLLMVWAAWTCRPTSMSGRPPSRPRICAGMAVPP